MLKKLSSALHRTVDGVKRWIEGNLYKKMSTRYISAASGYCGRYLREGFKKMTGISLVRYIRLRKLTEAAHLLRLTGRPVTDIAVLYAFSSLQSFSRAFSRHFGISPHNYRLNENWDLHHSLPAPAHTNFRYTCQRLYRGGLWLKPLHHQKIKIPLKKRLVITERGELRDELYTLLYNRLFRHNRLAEFTVLTHMVNRDTHDLWLHTTTCSRTQTEDPGALFIPPGEWIYFTFSGPLKKIMVFHQWVVAHGLKKHHVSLKGNTTTTVYHRYPDKPDWYTASYCLPCSPADVSSHTRRNREALPAV
ncbi:hypothetical protein CC387_08535 [Salmonella enterica subsp. enterica serovar Newport]|nr:hypothetical protein [Salmonella enterica subsp. enterica serovar Newport]EMC1106832.1 helix-turn-helix domain-containing protein [Salmonella enterica]